MTNPAFIKPVFDHAIRNRVGPLDLLTHLGASWKNLVDDFNAAMKRGGHEINMGVWSSAGDVHFILRQGLEDDVQQLLMSLEVSYDAERQLFVSIYNPSPEDDADEMTERGVTLDVEDYPLTERGIQSLSVDGAEKILRHCPVTIWQCYRDYVDLKMGQMAFQF